MEVLRLVPKQSLGILLTKGTVPRQGQYNTQHSSWSSSLSRARRQPTTFTGQEANLLVKKPTSWYKPQCGSTRHKPLARFYTVYSPTAGQ
ncbi:hypothetical protein Taro_017965 [Colocasia esculenta]|uniref:Uncharacterized protein n=1 Tax=Colocasia esculenta TaxID=4460 RepID=A0A843USI7_COLES|nr:hypothetical protein [Colocasia esculenta]